MTRSRPKQRRGAVMVGMAVSIGLVLMLVIGVIDILLALAYATGLEAAANQAVTALERGASLADAEAAARRVATLGSGITITAGDCYATLAGYAAGTTSPCTGAEIATYTMEGTWAWMSPTMRGLDLDGSLKITLQLFSTRNL